MAPSWSRTCHQTQGTKQITLGANSVFMSRWLFSDKIFQWFNKIKNKTKTKSIIYFLEIAKKKALTQYPRLGSLALFLILRLSKSHPDHFYKEKKLKILTKKIQVENIYPFPQHDTQKMFPSIVLSGFHTSSRYDTFNVFGVVTLIVILIVHQVCWTRHFICNLIGAWDVAITIIRISVIAIRFSMTKISSITCCGLDQAHRSTQYEETDNAQCHVCRVMSWY